MLSKMSLALKWPIVNVSLRTSFLPFNSSGASSVASFSPPKPMVWRMYARADGHVRVGLAHSKRLAVRKPRHTERIAEPISLPHEDVREKLSPVPQAYAAHCVHRQRVSRLGAGRQAVRARVFSRERWVPLNCKRGLQVPVPRLVGRWRGGVESAPGPGTASCPRAGAELSASRSTNAPGQPRQFQPSPSLFLNDLVPVTT